MLPLIYVAGPYRAATRDDIARNIDAARVVGISAAALGWFPVIPHANTAHMELDLPGLGDDFWLAGTLEMMERCDAVVLVPGWQNSAGTRGEIIRAEELGIPSSAPSTPSPAPACSSTGRAAPPTAPAHRPSSA